MTGINLIRNCKALISVRVTLDTIPTNGNFKCDSKNDSKSNYTNSSGNNNEQKYNYNNDNNDDKNNSNTNNKFFDNNNNNNNND